LEDGGHGLVKRRHMFTVRENRVALQGNLCVAEAGGDRRNNLVRIKGVGNGRHSPQRPFHWR